MKYAVEYFVQLCGNRVAESFFTTVMG